MLYKKNSQKALNSEVFKNPTAEYRGTPFWALNSYLTKDELLRQIDVFKEMGLGGFHLHVRTGLENEYLSDEYMSLMKSCVEKAKKEDMLAWLYDEDRWPSGGAGGLVTKDERFRARCLLFTPFLEACSNISQDSRAEGGRTGKGKPFAAYDIILDDDGFLKEYKKIGLDEQAKGTKWYAILEVHAPSRWYNNQTYLDTLNKKAVEKFVEVTHEKYLAYVGDEFDKTIPAIFTDEPQFTKKRVLNNSFDKMDITMPWTDDVPKLYMEKYSSDILDYLPEIFWDLPDNKISLHRYRYHDFIAELFASSFADTVGNWCNKHNIALTGHMMDEPTLHTQTGALGEAMRSYRSFQLPGIDMLSNLRELTTAKQAQSAVHQFGYEGLLSELYGVTGWDCDFRTYKYQGDWQACLGITIRVPHLSWYAMKGEAKRDYPASIHYQSPWYKEYSVIENHFARLNTALTRGKPVVKVGVIHPVESFWLHWGPNDKSAVIRESLDERFKNITEWLLEGSVDFDFISEALLPSLCEKADAPLKVGKMEYDVIIVPGCETLRSTTVERLNAFKNKGGKLIFMGDAPKYVDAVLSDEAQALFDISDKADFSRASILLALEKHRNVTIRYANGSLSKNFIYQMRKDNDNYWLFICNSREPYNKHIDGGKDIQIILNGKFTANIYDTQTGEIYPCKTEYTKNQTIIRYKLFAYDSLLLELKEGENHLSCEQKLPKPVAEGFPKSVPYVLSEDNALLLDIAQYKLDDDKEYSEKEEILRADNIIRERLGLNPREAAVVQPWVIGKKPKDHKVYLKYTFTSEECFSDIHLALEDARDAKISFNGKNVDIDIVGYYVDIGIDKIKLPDIIKGENVLEIEYTFGENSNLEAIYVLGNFAVYMKGINATLKPLEDTIPFGSLTQLGLPFYSGNITYKMKAHTENNSLTVTASDYFGALIQVAVDKKPAGYIIYPPYTLEINDIENGEHDVDITCYLHRFNSFGAVHLVDLKAIWHGPNTWRSKGDNWSYEYVLRNTGILKTPGIK